MKIYENNMADQALVVNSLRVLENVDGGAFKEIKQNVEAVKKQTNVLSRQQDEYWKILSDDGIITPIEKQSLLRESRNIDRSFAAITQQASELGIASSILEDYIATYDDIHYYLFTTLKLFDDMTSETQIDDRDTFNQYFSSYYFAENFVLLGITAGILDTIDFRVLQSLTEPGEENETAIYHGALYQYVNGQWKNVTTGAYKGPRSELPPDEEEAFFIVSESFTMSESLIVNDEELLVNDEVLLVSHTYLKGYIYYFQAGTWHPEYDKTNWRYAAAFADVLNITGELPQIFQDGLDAIQANLDAAVATLEDEIAAKQGQYTIIGGELILIDDLLPQIIDDYNQQQTEIDSKVDHLPVYYGGTSTAPVSPQEGDFYLYTGTGENNCKVRRYHNAAWEWLDPTNTNYRNYYMMALQDILSNTNAGTATFSTAFAGSFWAACANMDTLDVKTIYLRSNGAIQSDNLTYSEETRGLRIDADGNLDANGNTHLGATSSNKVAIGVPLTGNTDFNTYDVVIGGKTAFKSSIINDSFSIKKIESGIEKLYESSTENMSYGNFVRTLLYLFNKPFPGWNQDFGYTIYPDLNFKLTQNGTEYSNILFITIQGCTYTPARSADVNPEYCYVSVTTRSFVTNSIINIGSTQNPEPYWEQETLGGITKFEFFKESNNLAQITLGDLPVCAGDTGDLYFDHGFLKVSGKTQPWKYFEFDSGTDVRWVYDSIKPHLTTGYEVACLGYYGTSDSSHNNAISTIRTVGADLVFKNVNETEKLVINSNKTYGQSSLDGKLVVLFLSV